MSNYKRVYLKHFDYGEQDFVPCECCGSRAVDIHHLVFRSQGGTDEIENLAAVCRECHNQAHNDPFFNEQLKKYHKDFITNVGCMGRR